MTTRRPLATALVIALVIVVSAGLYSTRARAAQVSFELRHTPILVRPNRTPSLCPMLALSFDRRWWFGVGYELIQDYDAVLWKSELEGHKPLVMSGIRAGAWYRGGALRQGLTYSMGGILTYANPATSLEGKPTGIDSDTSVMDFGADFTLGRVWESFIIQLFATPAWSRGRVVSKAVHRTDTYSAFTYRVGGALVFIFGS